MKKIISNLEKQLESLREHISNREDTFLDRTERWQESEKGEFYADQTSEIEQQADELEAVIDELKELL